MNLYVWEVQETCRHCGEVLRLTRYDDRPWVMTCTKCGWPVQMPIVTAKLKQAEEA